jgi:hypothetical protein
VKPTLSKGVMTMKFMKRKSDADIQLREEAEKRRKLIDNAWTSEGMKIYRYVNTFVCLSVYECKYVCIYVRRNRHCLRYI